MEGIDKVQGKRKKARPPRGAARRSIHSRVHSHPFEVRRKAVQLYLEEGFPPELVAREMGVGQSTLSKWVRLYRDHGEASLQSKPAGPRRSRPKVARAVKAKVVEVKRRHPGLGIQKISQFLRRVLFLPVSRELAQQRQAELRHITWHVPGLVW
jgi:transposase-like protein